MKRSILRSVWSWLRLWWKNSLLRIKQDRFVASLMPGDISEAQRAILKVTAAHLFPPDCLSAGAVHGGPALILKHDGAVEVFIGRTYDHAADELLKWWRQKQAVGIAPTTKTTTKLNRASRRAWASNRQKG